MVAQSLETRRVFAERQVHALRVLRRHRTLAALAVVQALCGIWFLADVLMEIPQLWLNPWHQIPEAGAVALLWAGTLLCVRKILELLRRSDAMEARLSAASQAFQDLVEEALDSWGVTEAERDVAILSLKGLSISEIAKARGTRPGTVRAQSAALYRKAGVSNRLQLLSLFMDELAAGLVLE
jgi:DNA-binding CsgD family transcriptional regulator